jgi:hypothetical protein
METERSENNAVVLLHSANMSQHSQPKKRVLTLKEKINVVEFYEKQKVSVRALASKFKIGKTQAANIISKRSELLRKLNANENDRN